MANLITIDQLLESVDLNFEPRYITKDKYGDVRFWEREPIRTNTVWTCGRASIFIAYKKLKLAEFENKPWQECIYEVPRKNKPVVKIEKLNLLKDSALLWGKKINELVVAVNELKAKGNR